MNMATLRWRIALTLLTLASLLILLPGRSAAQRTKDVTIGFVLQEGGGSLVCRNIEPLGCSDKNAVISGTLLTEYFAIACVFNATPKDFDPEDYGISGVQFGIDYDGGSQSGVDILSWTTCADGLDIPSDNWPSPKSGTTITWIVDRDTGDGCQDNVPGAAEDGVTAIIGYFSLTAYSTDQLSVIENRTLQSPFLGVTTCPFGNTYEIPLEQTGTLGFSSDLSETGNIPCVHHVGETTWGRIKSTYGH